MKKLLLSLSILALVTSTVFAQRLYWAWAQVTEDLSSYNLDDKSSQEIEQLNNDISSKKNSIDDLKRKQEAYKAAIRAKQSEKADLESQLAIYDNRLAAIRANAEDVKLNIEKTMLEIKRTDLEITLKEQAIAKERERIGLALSLLYKEGNKTDLEILFSNDSLSDYINQLEYLKDINSSIKDSLIKLKIASERLAQDKKELEVKKLSLLSLEEDLLNKQDILTGEMDSRELVLDQTKASESEYQRLLNQVKREQDLASADVVYLEKTIRDKLAKSKKLDALNDSVTAFVWPVPSKIITTYFHDPDYPYRNLFEHPALDIKAKQSTPIKAAAAGYVGRVKSDGSTSYAYIMIVHGDDLATVYGHISKALVKEGQYVNQGDTIALSGGAPNQTGSGPLTTGPHLHFEVRLRGIPVNPLSYLQ